MKKNARLTALTLAAILAAVMLFSVLFVAAEADHDCSGEDCAVCFQINICVKTLESCTRAVASAAVAAFVCAAAAVSVCACMAAAENDSLVTLKVKLSD